MRVRLIIKKTFKFFYYKYRFLKLKIYLIFSEDSVNLILGAALTNQKGWFSTNEDWLDISKAEHWNKLFNSKKRVKRVLAEHVFEHLTINEMRNSLRLIFANMINGGSLRIAVPDGNNPNSDYRKHCGINGIGADASDHKQFLTYELLSREIEAIGFDHTLIEGYLKNKELVSKSFNDNLGKVIRSRRNSFNLSKKGWDFYDSNTSLIIDCFKNTNN
ncbi:SAM-dependent methyltransferase family protein [Prochlorococcus marinus str. MIT 9202]|nr:SAM-dependent methyltransferase family protein [Prochlorococcus marinus str. MIT 9202]